MLLAFKPSEQGIVEFFEELVVVMIVLVAQTCALKRLRIKMIKFANNRIESILDFSK